MLKRMIFLVFAILMMQGVCFAATRLPSDVKNTSDAMLHLSVQDAKGKEIRSAFYIVDGNSFIGAGEFSITRKVRIVPEKMEFDEKSQSLGVSLKLMRGDEDIRTEAYELKYDDSAKIEYEGFVITVTCRKPVRTFL